MRTSVIAPFGIAALVLGVWYATDRSENVEPAPDRSASDVARPAVKSEPDSAAGRDAAPPTGPPDDRAPNDEQAPVAGRQAIRNPYREPEFRDALAAYLVASGLSALDSENIVTGAIDSLSECVTSSDFDPEGRAIAICNQNALQQAGVSEAVFQAALVETGSRLSRRLALQGARGWQVGVSLSFRERTNGPEDPAGDAR